MTSKRTFARSRNSSSASSKHSIGSNRRSKKKKPKNQTKSYGGVRGLQEQRHSSNYANHISPDNRNKDRKSKSYFINSVDSNSPEVPQLSININRNSTNALYSNISNSSNLGSSTPNSSMSPRSLARRKNRRSNSRGRMRQGSNSSKKGSNMHIQTSLAYALPKTKLKKRRRRKNKIKVIQNTKLKRNEWRNVPKKTVNIPTPMIFTAPSPSNSPVISKTRINFNNRSSKIRSNIIHEDKEKEVDEYLTNVVTTEIKFPSKPDYAESVLTEKPEKFNASEMKWVVEQIALMKKSWRTPIEEVQRSIYKIVDLPDRRHLNNQFVKVLLILDDENYRIQLCNNLHSEHVIPSRNLEVAFETENLYILFSSMKSGSDSNYDTLNSSSQIKSKRKTAKDILQQQMNLHQPMPPKLNIDDLHTIQAFEREFDEIYNFKRLDYHIICVFFVFAIIIFAAGICIYIFIDKSQSLGAIIMIYGPLLCIIYGLIFGCLWFCRAVQSGKIDIYLGNNKFFGYECFICDCCKYQYFIMIAISGIILLIISFILYIIYPVIFDAKKYFDKQMINLLFLASMISSFMLFVGAILICYCFRTWKRRDSIWEPEKKFAN